MNDYPDYFEQIALGEIPRKSSLSKFGYATVGSTEVGLWDNASSYTFLTDGQIISLASDSADDVYGGVGAWNVRLFGLDINHDLIVEDIELNGLTPVLTLNAFHRLNRMIVINDGNQLIAGGSNSGNITAISTTSADLQAKILEHEGQTLMCIYTTPRGYKALLWAEANSLGSDKSAIFRLKWRNDSSENNGSFSTKSIRNMFESAFQKNKKIPIPIDEMTDIVMTAQSSVSTTTVSGSFDIELVEVE